MKKIIKYIIYILLNSILLLILFGQTNSSNAETLYSVDVYNSPGMTNKANITLGKNKVFCIQQGKKINSGDKYKIISSLSIHGNRCNNGGIEYINNDNLNFAWILDQPFQESDMHAQNYSDNQKAVYQEVGTWEESNGVSIATNSGGQTIPAGWTAPMQEYVDAFNQPNATITNNTNKNNLGKEMYQSADGKIYIKVGPINWSYTGNYIDKAVYDQNNNLITVNYAKFVGNDFQIYDNITAASTSGQDFYLLIPGDQGITKINKITATVKVTKEIKNATIVFYEGVKDKNNHEIGYDKDNVSKNQHIISVITSSEDGSSYATVEMTDIDLTGNIRIIKTDEDNKAIKLSNVGFKIKNKQTNKYVKQERGVNIYVNNISDATEFITDKEGKVDINNLLIGDYIAYETKNPNYGYEILENGINLNVIVNKTSEYSVTNKRVYIKLSGYVWEDNMEDNKESTSNGLYNDTKEDRNDKLMQYVTVKLKDEKGNIVEKIDSKENIIKDDYGNSIKMETVTDINGSYIFKDILIDKLKNYYIEFTYNGMSYESVKINAQDLVKANSSKAAEGENRKNYNNKYAKINSGDYATTQNEKDRLPLKYTSKEYTSSIKYGDNLKYGYKDAEDPVNGTYEQYLIQSNTKNGYNGYLNSIVLEEKWERKYAGANKVENYIRWEGIEEIKNINLGLKRREKPNLSVVKDIQSAKVSINGEDHVYEYAQRATNIYGDGHDIAVKFGTKYGNMSYTRAIYASDIKYTGSNKLDVKVTYKIEIKNHATTIDGTIYQLKEYYDTKYDVVNVWSAIETDKGVYDKNLVYEFLPNENGITNYNTIAIYPGADASVYSNEQRSLVPGLEVLSQTSKSIYIELKVKPDQILKLVDDNTNKIVKLDNVTEISRYGSKEEIINKDGTKRVGSAYAGIDKNSKPGNAIPGDTKTYEDDTDQAPGLKLVLQEEREITGTVFEDKSTTGEDIITGKIRQGNGQLDTGENKIAGATVQLLYKEENTGEYKVGKMYDFDRKIWIDAVTTTDSDGNFRLGGFIPGDYELQYIWGDKKYTVQDYKSTIVNKNTYENNLKNDQWYKNDIDSRNSDAVDDYEIRKTIDKQITVENYSEKQRIKSAYEGNKEVVKLTSQQITAADVNEDGIITNEDSNLILKHDGGFKEITNGRGDINGDGKIDYKDATLILQNIVITKMESTTPEFKINLEYDRNPTGIKDEYEVNEDGTVKKKSDGTEVQKIAFENKIRNIDFGIIRRANQVLKLDKQIKNATITLANGNQLIDAKFKENGELDQITKYVSYIPKSEKSNAQVKIEVDNELLQGSRLETTYSFKIENVGEVEYLTEDYYKYGKGYGETDEVEIAPDKIIDYVDNDVAIDNTVGSWKNIAKTELYPNIKDDLLIRKAKDKTNNIMDMEKYVNGINNILVSSKLNTTFLWPERKVNVEFKSTKVLSSQEEINVDNNTEILEVTKNGGSQIIVTPGNYIPIDEETIKTTSEVDDSRAATLIVLPPTGQNNNIIACIVLTISSLGILLVGIIIIKKYVLTK